PRHRPGPTAAPGCDRRAGASRPTAAACEGSTRLPYSTERPGAAPERACYPAQAMPEAVDASARPSSPTDYDWQADPDGLPRRGVSADGTPLVRRDSSGPDERLWLRLPDHREIALRLDAADHPVLGRCDVVLGPDGERLAHASA